jgi:hypothetical protein
MYDLPTQKTMSFKDMFLKKNRIIKDGTEEKNMKGTYVFIVVCILILLSTMVPTSGALTRETTLHPLPYPSFEYWLRESRVFVKNIGDVNLTNVSVRRYLDGGIIFLNKDKTVNISSIAVGETKEVKLGWIVGLGISVMTISITCDEGAFGGDDFRIFMFFFFFIVDIFYPIAS